MKPRGEEGIIASIREKEGRPKAAQVQEAEDWGLRGRRRSALPIAGAARVSRWPGRILCRSRGGTMPSWSSHLPTRAPAIHHDLLMR